MNCLPLPLRVGAACAASLSTLSVQAAPEPILELPRPNIVLIMADDLGWGDVGFQGQSRIQTPHLDALAASGRVYHRGFCPAAVCGPTRAALKTGFHSGHTYLDRNQDLGTAFRDEDIMISEVLREAGYRTAAFGKWGFGTDSNDNLEDLESLPPNQGFEDFYGYLGHKAAHDYFNSQLWRNDPDSPSGVSAESTGGVYTHDLIAAESENYLSTHAGGPEPFFLYVAYTIPHFDLDAIAGVPGWFDAYDDVPGASSWSSKQKKYAAMITRMDASIGELIDRLKDPNQDGNTDDSIYEDTLVIFTSDNGPTAEDNAPISFFDSNGPWRGGKRDLWDGGVRVPLVYSWPGKIAPSTTDFLTDLCDLFPTLATLGEADSPAGLDGVSLVPDLFGLPGQKVRGYLSFEHHETDGPDPDGRDARWAIRTETHKLIKFSNGDVDLYDLVSNPSETNDISGSHPELVAELTALATREKLEAPGDYAVTYAVWTGSDGDSLAQTSSWDVGTAPNDGWSATMDNTGTTPATASWTAGILRFLGLGISGSGAMQTIAVGSGAVLEATNSIEIHSGGRVNLEGGLLGSDRWVCIDPDGNLTGYGTVAGRLQSEGTISVMNGAVTAPAATVNTGEVVAVAFDFDGTQNANPLGATTTLSPNVSIGSGLAWGSGLAAAVESTDAGDEFNVIGFETGGGVTNAIAAGDYVRFILTPLPGIEMTLREVSFTLWRNGTNAATDYAVAVRPLGASVQTWATVQQDRVTSGAESAVTLTGLAPDGGTATTSPVEVFLVGWNAMLSGNTHVTAARARAAFVSTEVVVPEGLHVQGDMWLGTDSTLAFDLSDLAPLDVTGSLHLGGALEVSGDASAFEPGETVSLLRAGSTSGIFASVSLPVLPMGLAWNTEQARTEGTLTAEPKNAFFQWLLDEGVPYEDWSPAFDGDGDRVPAGIEFLTGGSLSAYDSPPASIAEDGTLCVTLEDDRADELAWVLQFSEDLVSWAEVPMSEIDTNALGDGRTEYCWSPPAGLKRIFLRLYIP